MSTPDRPFDPPTDPTMPPPPPYPAGEPTAYAASEPTSYQAPPPTGYATTPQPYGGAPAAAPLAPEAEKQVAALAHGLTGAATLLSGGTLGFVVALVMYLIYRDRGPFVRAHVANALNVQIVTGIGLIVSAVLMIILVGFITYPLVWILGIVMHIIGTMKALNGEWWKPMFTPDFVK